ncbi:MAG: hypothetical protein JW944_02520 [Deltaproteobacteria bacterium]|nr:hypothetical protein [Deltaproteobacteria bacterium]
MIKVFIGGSRNITRLTKDIKNRIDNIIQKGYGILIGDANGADKAVQKYLSEMDYQNVLVFCMDRACRNNVGSWEMRHIEGKGKIKDFSYYSIKDLEMAINADYGFMLWDGKSKGTLNNIINLLKRQKKVLVYFSPEKGFYNLISFYELERLLSRCEKSDLEDFENRFGVSQFIKKETQVQQEIRFPI